MITRSRKLSLKLVYQLTHKTMICRSKCRPLNRSSIATNRCISSSSPATHAFAPAIFSIQSGLYAQFPVIRAVVNDSSPDGRLSKSFAAARCLEATQGASSLLELHAGGSHDEGFMRSSSAATVFCSHCGTDLCACLWPVGESPGRRNSEGA